MEIEKDKTLPFLDLHIKRKPDMDKQDITVYRKPTFTDLGLNFYSHCPLIYKINSIKTLLHRAYGICSNYMLMHKEIEFLKSYFKKNNYSEKILNKTIK